MKPGDFVSVDYYNFIAYGYIEDISDYGIVTVLQAYRVDRDTKMKSWKLSGQTLDVSKADCKVIQNLPYKEDVDELINLSLYKRDFEWTRELSKGV
jgi:hypothetical protein